MVRPIGYEVIIGGLVKIFAAGMGEYASAQRPPRGYSDRELHDLAEIVWRKRSLTYSRPCLEGGIRLLVWEKSAWRSPERKYRDFVEAEVPDKVV